MDVTWPIFRSIIPELDGISLRSTLLGSVSSSVLDLALENDHTSIVSVKHLHLTPKSPVKKLELESGKVVSETAVSTRQKRISRSNDSVPPEWTPSAPPQQRSSRYDDPELQDVVNQLQAAGYAL